MGLVIGIVRDTWEGMVMEDGKRLGEDVKVVLRKSKVEGLMVVLVYMGF